MEPVNLRDFCFKCEAEITEKNKSDEHIILNSIGGRLKTKKLWCITCNGTFGGEIDAELSKQLNPIANLLNIERDRGEPQDIRAKKKDGEEIGIAPGGKPYFVKPTKPIEKISEGKVEISFRAPNKQIAKQTLTGLKRRYPQIDVEELVKKLRVETDYLEEPVLISTSVGGSECFRSIAKSALGFYLHSGGKREHIKHLFPFIEGIDSELPVWYYEPKPNIVHSEKDEIIHSLVVRGDTKKKILYSYVEFFSVHKFLVKLNGNYKGEEFFSSYLYDPVRRREITEKQIELRLPKQKIEEIFAKKKFPYKRVKESMIRLMEIIHRPQTDEGIIDKAIKKTLGSYPEGTVITQEMINELSHEVAQGLMPRILRASHRKRKEAEEAFREKTKKC